MVYAIQPYRTALDRRAIRAGWRISSPQKPTAKAAPTDDLVRAKPGFVGKEEARHQGAQLRGNERLGQEVPPFI